MGEATGDAYRREHVLHRLFRRSGRARRGPGGTGLRLAVGAGAFAHPALARIVVPRLGRDSQEVLRRHGSLRDADGCRRGDGDVEARHGDLPRGAARSHPDGQAGRLDRSGVGRTFPVRRRQRLERRGDGGSRDRLRGAARGGPGAHRRDEGDLDADEARIPRRDRRFPSHDGVAQARAEALPSGDRRRRLPPWGAARGRLRGRLDSPRAAARVRGRHRSPGRIPPDGGGGRPGPGVPPGDGPGGAIRISTG